MRPNRVALLVICVTLLFSVALAQSGAGSDIGWPDLPSAEALLDVFYTIQDSYYLAPADLDENALWQAAIEGMVNALPDRYSFYTSPSVAAESEATSGDQPFGGIGATLAELDPVTEIGTQVVGVIQGAPAERAGLLPGDVILEVDGRHVPRQPLRMTRLMIVGEVGTAVHLLVARPGLDEPLSFEITRGQIDSDSVEIVTSRLLDDGVGYLSFGSFEEPELGRLVKEHLRQLREAGATALVLDLRDNIGGDTRIGRDVLGQFLSLEDLWTFRARDRFVGTDRSSYLSSREAALPMVVLVNGRTISMGETTAAVLQHYGRALVVGERTWGKGFATRTIDLPDAGALTYVLYELLMPDGESLEGVGVTPDVYAPDTRRPRMVVVSGYGAQPGQVVELTIDGVVVGRTTAGEEGFDIIGIAEGSRYPSGSNLVADPATDAALQVAVATVIELRVPTETPVGD